MHEDIVKFSREGEIRDDSDFIRLKAELIKGVYTEMRDCGYIPVLDLNAHWSTQRIEDGDKSRYSFRLSVFGVFLEGQDCTNKGLDNGKIIKTA